MTDQVNFGAKNFEARNFADKNFVGGGVQNQPQPPATIYYAERSDIELIFGKANVAKWADVDNEENLNDIEGRINWSLESSHNEINSRLLGGPYTIPFITPYPQPIVVQCARMSGIMLYDSRGITDFSEDGLPKHQLFYHKELCKNFFNFILSRRLRLPGILDIASTIPTVVE